MFSLLDAGATQIPETEQPRMIPTIIMMVALLAIIYFLLIRPINAIIRKLKDK